LRFWDFEIVVFGVVAFGTIAIVPRGSGGRDGTTSPGSCAADP